MHIQKIKDDDDNKLKMQKKKRIKDKYVHY